MAENPFNFGDLALDEVFTDRETELAELTADIRNGQNVVIFAPRRFGKSSLVWRASSELIAANEALIAQVDLMRTPTKELLAARLAEAIYDQIATPLMRARERATNVFRGLRISPSITVDPEDGRVRFSFTAGLAPADVDATLERLLELPAELAADRGRRVAIVFDEFQEVIDLDPRLPALMRSVFQTQPHVAHVYLGSKRSLMERLFNDVNEPFWRSARQMELGPIAPESFAPFIRERFASTGRAVDENTVAQVLANDWRAPLRDAGALLRALGSDRRRRDGRRGDLRHCAGSSAAIGARTLHARLGRGFRRAAPHPPGARRGARNGGHGGGVSASPRPSW